MEQPSESSHAGTEQRAIQRHHTIPVTEHNYRNTDEEEASVHCRCSRIVTKRPCTGYRILAASATVPDKMHQITTDTTPVLNRLSYFPFQNYAPIEGDYCNVGYIFRPTNV